MEQGLRFLRNMLLTRLLAPEVFGAMAIVIAVNSAFQSFTEIGVKQAIIQNSEGHRREYLNGAWWLAAIRGLLLYVLAYGMAPYISRFYDNEDLALLLRVAFLSVVFSGVLSAQAYVSLKKMNFKSWVFIYNLGGSCGVLATVILALVVPNVWALVIGFTVEAGARCILSYVICPFRPGLTFRKVYLIALLKYARGMLGLPILTFIFLRADIFVIGKLCTATELGLYSMAVALAQIPIQCSTIVAEVMMPTFSEMQNDKVRMNRSILQITTIIAFLGFPILVLLALAGKDILILVYGQQYGGVALPLTIVFATALMRVCSLPIATVYLAIGRPALHRLFVGIRALLIIILISPAVKTFGLAGGAMAGLVSMLVAYLFQALQIRHLTRLDLWHYALVFTRALALSVGGIVVWITVSHLAPSLPFSNLVSGVTGWLCTLGFAFWVFHKTVETIHTGSES